ncbi:MAG: hypothetical protein R3F48_04395 [Candidatus Zixiibacteriota bacterium]
MESLFIKIGLKIGELFLPLVQWIFKYPVDIQHINQFETKKGYVFQITIKAKSKKIMKIPKKCVRFKILKDKELVKSAEKEKIIYGESIIIFNSQHTLEAYLNDLSYGNEPDYLILQEQVKTIYAILRVEGPGPINPSLRLQLGPLYIGVRILIKKSGLWLAYQEVSLNKLPIIAGNGKTRIS